MIQFPTKPSMSLAAALSKVPYQDLARELSDRGYQLFKKDPYTEEDSQLFRDTLKALVETCHHTEAEIMGSTKEAPLVQTRWELYLQLFDHGFSPYTIGKLCGHDRTRVYYGLRQRGISFTK